MNYELLMSDLQMAGWTCEQDGDVLRCMHRIDILPGQFHRIEIGTTHNVLTGQEEVYVTRDLDLRNKPFMEAIRMDPIWREFDRIMAQHSAPKSDPAE